MLRSKLSSQIAVILLVSVMVATAFTTIVATATSVGAPAGVAITVKNHDDPSSSTFSIGYAFVINGHTLGVQKVTTHIYHDGIEVYNVSHETGVSGQFYSYFTPKSTGIYSCYATIPTATSNVVNVNVIRAISKLTANAPNSAVATQNFTIKGRLYISYGSESDVGQGNQPIILQRSLDNKYFTTIATTQTVTSNDGDRNGEYTFSRNETSAQTYYYRTTYAGNYSLTNVTSNTVGVAIIKKASTLSITTSNTSPAVNQQVTFTATLKSGTTPLSGESVTIYHYVNGVKYTDTTKKTNAYGKITISQIFASTGTRYYYATFAGDARYKTSNSALVRIVVN